MDEVAGYRVLRSAGHGSRSRLVLGYEEGRTVVLKVCAADDPRVATELAALDRAAGEHVVDLLDVAADEHGTVLVLERLPGGSLAELLERRAALAAGEAVTILAPLASTIERLHSAGVAHGALSLGAVLFRDDGAPVLTGFGSAELFTPGAPEVVRETVPGVVADRAALRDLARVVLGRVDGNGAPAARRLAERIPVTGPAELGDALYAVAVPSEIVLDGDAPADADAGAEAAREVRFFDTPMRDGAESRPGILAPWIVALLPDSVRAPVTTHTDALRARWESWPIVRRRLALGLGVSGLTFALALALLPASPSTVSASVAPPTPAASLPEASASHEPVAPDDPVEAAALLLARRDECVRELSVLCLDTVVQAGSAAHADDVALVRSVLGGAEYPERRVLEGIPVLVERLGDSALLDLPVGSSPASLLVVRTAEGWRIRSYLDAPAFETGTR